MTSTTLGVFILWLGWYGFNCGSTLALTNGNSIIASHIAINTTFCGAAGTLMAAFVSRVFYKKYNLELIMNGALAGLVASTSPVAVMDPPMAIIVGAAAFFAYFGLSRLLLKLKIDDPLDAFPVHAGAGALSVIAPGLFATRENILRTYQNRTNVQSWGLFYGGGFSQLAAQLIYFVCIVAWVSVTETIIFFTLSKLKILRVNENLELGSKGDVSHEVVNTSFDE